jgi:hypothetical protein
MKWKKLTVTNSNAQGSAVLWNNIFMYILIEDNQPKKAIGIYVEEISLF